MPLAFVAQELLSGSADPRQGGSLVTTAQLRGCGLAEEEMSQPNTATA